jgi:arabinogalactan oligomer/maltooligosaccharide transport system permease protein
MLKGFFDSLPRELEEAALLDGSTRLQAFLHVALPLARPAIAVTALFSFLAAWNEFILAATLMNDPTSFTLPVQLQRYVGDFSTEWGRFAAGAILVSLPVMALFLSLEKHLTGGLTQGGVKG